MNKQFDFTIKKYTEILDCLVSNGYSFQSLEDFFQNPVEKVVILRHDVDRSPHLSLNTARLENSLGIRGTYYFRIVKESNDPGVIKEIAEMSHEIGYHYEDLALSKGIHEDAIMTFESNLDYFRNFYPVKTISMHGSPVSKWDNRDLWYNYSYRDFGIIAEPYFDIDYTNLLYLTDTGRKWNGDRSSVRDKVFQENYKELKERLKNSDNILAAASEKKLPEQLMITIHPQRWSDDLFIWMWEYMSQSVKNVLKTLIFVK
jgi:hypothetical protein